MVSQGVGGSRAGGQGVEQRRADRPATCWLVFTMAEAIPASLVSPTVATLAEGAMICPIPRPRMTSAGRIALT